MSGSRVVRVLGLSLALLWCAGSSAPAEADNPTPEVDRPALLLRAAEAELSLGQDWSGQRLLELLVARYPDAAEAIAARRTLGGIYTRSMTVAERPDVESKPVPVWRTELHLPSARQAELRDAAGDRVFFPDGVARLGARAREVVQAQARWLNTHPDLTVDVEGHADDRGTPDVLDALAGERARVVARELVEAGVASSRITVRAVGAQAPIAMCQAPECAAQNRRVVVVVTERVTGRSAVPGARADTVAQR